MSLLTTALNTLGRLVQLHVLDDGSVKPGLPDMDEIWHEDEERTTRIWTICVPCHPSPHTELFQAQAQDEQSQNEQQVSITRMLVDIKATESVDRNVLSALEEASGVSLRGVRSFLGVPNSDQTAL